jgi:RNA polymerase sigma-70 factor (family 1)
LNAAPQTNSGQNKEKFLKDAFNSNFAWLYSYSKKMVQNDQVAEDITIESFSKLWERLDGFSNKNAIRSFLTLTARNACLNYIRDNAKRHTRQQDFLYLVETETSSYEDNLKMTANIFQLIYNEVEKLSPQLQTVFKLAYFEGLSNDEIAAQLHISNQSVRNDKSRALKQLRMAFYGKDLLPLFLLLFV